MKLHSTLRGLAHWIDTDRQQTGIIFLYHCTTYGGHLPTSTAEGTLEWIVIDAPETLTLFSINQRFITLGLRI